MKEEDKIAIYYIATGKYKKLFPDFLKSVHNFFPKNKKIVKVISDGLEEYKDYEEDNVKVELCPRINDYPWPIVALYKMYLIKENMDNTCEYSCYFNANSIIYPHKKNRFKLNKVTVSYHSFNSKYHEYDPWEYININKYSTAYLENKTYEYIQSGFFFGKTEIIKKLCEEVITMLKEDTRRNMFAQWHDESYLNKWCVINKEIVSKEYIMTVFQDEIDEDRFIYLRNKKEYDINK